jgi:MOSC domain-containing protein YiiM
MSGVVTRLWLHDRAAKGMREVAAARAVSDFGFEGCDHARPGKGRQVLLLDEETLAELRVPPGRAHENVTTRGIAIQALAAGALVRVGAATLEITGPCEPCGFMDGIRPGLREASMGRRGVLARVREGGEVRVGDEVRAESR